VPIVIPVAIAELINLVEYLLKGDADTTETVSPGETADGSVKTEVETARQRISKAAGVSPTA
jgi:hypothetical protein